MNYYLHLACDGRILYASFEEYAAPGDVAVENLPEGNLSDYRYCGGELVFDPLPSRPPEPELPDVQTDMDEMLIEHEYRLTLLELGLSDT